MKRVIVGWAVAAALTASAWPVTAEEAAALVAAAEGGDARALAEGITCLRAQEDAPLAGAALGRLYILQSRGARFQLLAFLGQYRGFRALGKYVARHPDEPLPRVWRAASAVETNYVFHNAARARADTTAALALYEADAAAPLAARARCYLLLGVIAKDEGLLDDALAWWSRAFAADPTGPAGTEAARLLALFTG